MSTLQGVGSIVTDGLVMYLDAANYKSYPGSGTAWTDLTINGNNGTLVGSPTYNSANAGSISFNGTNYTNVGSSSTLKPSSITVSCWIKGQSGVSLGVVVDGDSNGATRGYLMYLYPSAVIEFQSRNTPSVRGIATSTSLVSTSSICNAVGTYDGSSIKIYFNGILENQSLYSTPTAYGGGNIFVGKYQSFGGANPENYSFSGSIYSAQIYNRALSATEILQNYNSSKKRFGL